MARDATGALSVIRAQAGNQLSAYSSTNHPSSLMTHWIPACAGMTENDQSLRVIGGFNRNRRRRAV